MRRPSKSITSWSDPLNAGCLHQHLVVNDILVNQHFDVSVNVNISLYRQHLVVNDISVNQNFYISVNIPFYRQHLVVLKINIFGCIFGELGLSGNHQGFQLIAILIKNSVTSKHRKNCEYCPVPQLNIRWQRLSWIQILNCQYL